MSPLEQTSRTSIATKVESTQSPLETKKAVSLDNFNGIAQLQGLPPEMKAKIHTIIGAIEAMELDIE